MKDKFLVLISYIFFVPSMYAILSVKRDNQYTRYHAAQAFFLWIIVISYYFLIPSIRYDIRLLTTLFGMITVVGIVSVIKEDFKIPILAQLIEIL